jgi:signal transduction histidine kinase
VNTLATVRWPRIRSFRTKLLFSMLLVVFGISAGAVYFAENRATTNVEENLQRQFQHELNALHQLQEARSADLIERCRALSWRSRIHAALEDNALDLLYPSAEGELQDLLAKTPQEEAQPGLKAEFYRFLGSDGRVLHPPKRDTAGALSEAEEARLALPHLPTHQETGYIEVSRPRGNQLLEVIAMPILSTESGEVISAIEIGFRPLDFDDPTHSSSIRTGIWSQGRLFVEGLSPAASTRMSEGIAAALRKDDQQGRLNLTVQRDAYLLVYYKLNPLSLFPPAYEVFVYPLSELIDRRAQIRWQIIGGSVFLLLIGFAITRVFAERLSAPVEKLEITSAENILQRERAEAALSSARTELQRSARFSADASHQLKTPVSVLRAGLEEWLARPNLTAEDIQEIAGMVHQTYRLASVIEDLLLLSRIDTGHLQLELTPVDLSALIDGWLDDLSTLPNPWELKVETEVPPQLYIMGEKRYTTMILQNLLENARKYNRPQGRIRIAARTESGQVILTVANTGKPIPPEAREHIFERFHRGNVGENIPGHGLGLNLARELARTHRGDLRLVRSDESWTEFEVRFDAAASPS